MTTQQSEQKRKKKERDMTIEYIDRNNLKLMLKISLSNLHT